MTKKTQPKTKKLAASFDNWLITDKGVAELVSSLEMAVSSGVKPKMRTEITRAGSALILPVHGPVVARSNFITEMLGIIPTEVQMERLQTAVDDDEEIILDIDTHGGDAALAFEYADLIHENRDRITTYTGGHATSAGQLFHAAGGIRVAHETAMMGSIGVVIGVGFDPGDRVIYSQNAENKRGTRDNLQNYANKLEASFLSYMSRFTGLTESEVVEAGDKGGIITGTDAESSKLIDQTGTLQSVKQVFLTMNEEEKQQLITDSQTKMNARWAACMAVGCGVELTKKIASNMAFNDEQAVEMLTDLKAETAAPAPAPAAPAAPAADQAPHAESKAESETNKAALALLSKIQTALSTDVNEVPTNTEDRREAEAEKATAAANAQAKDAEDFKTRMANMARATGYRNPAATQEAK